ncbi:MAG: type II toxin-antitoxin system prevent-host-death family antitoxin [Acidimicrobiia bacterium]
MTKVGIRALKQNASAVVAEVVAGEVVTITDRGRQKSAFDRSESRGDKCARVLGGSTRRSNAPAGRRDRA